MLFPLVFIFGFLAGCAALLVEVAFGMGFGTRDSSEALNSPGILTSAFVFIVLAAALEEGAKWIFLRQYAIRFRKAWVTPPSLALGTLFGFGFASLELGLIGFGMKEASPGPLLGLTLLHLATSLFFAYSLFRPIPRTLFHSILLFLGMTLLHAGYNLSRSW